MGKKKVAKYTKIGAVILGIFEAMAIANGLFAKAIVANGYIQSALIITSLLAGSMFLVWLGEIITEKGVGNGSFNYYLPWYCFKFTSSTCYIYLWN